MDLTYQDLIIRLQRTGCKYSELVNTFANNLKWGKQCAKSEWKNLILLNVYIEILEDYNINSTNNCVTKDQLNIIVNNISKLIKLKFQPPGFIYLPPPSSVGQFDDSFDDSFL